MDKIKSNFAKQMELHMQKEFGIKETEAARLVNRYIKEINTEEVVVQQLGPDYFVVQVLMAEGIIPYKPI